MPDNVFGEDAWWAVRSGLFDPTNEDSGQEWERAVLNPWLAAHGAVVAALGRLGLPEMAEARLSNEDSWTLYALSRVVELLIWPLQPVPDGSAPPASFAYGLLVEGLGGWWPGDAGFHPFLHEIVRVEPAEDPDEPPSVIHQWWPGFLVGSMLMTRAGVTVRAGANRIDSHAAQTSRLYWAWIRRHRPVIDLSHGWGHNSQWRTRFRRDYRVEGTLHYNVDGRFREPVDTPDLAEPEALELLRHRCGTRVDHGADVWIWDTCHTEAVPAPSPS